MTKQNRLGVAILAVVAIVSSFGLDWMHIQSAGLSNLTFDGSAIGQGFSMPQIDMGGLGLSLPVNAGNGSITVAGLALDIWLIITIALAGAVLGIVASGESAPVPRFVPFVALGVAAAFIGSGFLVVGDANASLAPGIFVAAAGVIASIVMLLVPATEPAT